MRPTHRRSLICILLLGLTALLGIAVRYAPLHLPWFWYKYLGSALWAMAVYWCAAAVLPEVSRTRLVLLAAAVALLVEFSRLTPQRSVDAFRLTLAGKLLLGRYFSVRNLVAYALGIAAATAADRRYLPGRR